MNQYTAHPVEPSVRFWSHVAKTNNPDDCWEWMAYKSKGRDGGYGKLAINKKPYSAHRYAWIITFGEIPDGLWVLHKCDNRACCNPNHLFLGTHQDNMNDKVNKGRASSLAGEINPSHKLTIEQVKYIKERYAQGGIGWQKLAKEVGISKRQVGRIIKGQSWK